MDAFPSSTMVYLVVAGISDSAIVLP